MKVVEREEKRDDEGCKEDEDIQVLTVNHLRY